MNSRPEIAGIHIYNPATGLKATYSDKHHNDPVAAMCQHVVMRSDLGDPDGLRFRVYTREKGRITVHEVCHDKLIDNLLELLLLRAEIALGSKGFDTSRVLAVTALLGFAKLFTTK